MNAPFSLKYLAAHIGESFQGDGEKLLYRVASLDKAGPEDLAFVASEQYRKALMETQAGAVILHSKDASNFVGNAIVVPNPHLAYAKLVVLFSPKKNYAQGIHATAVINPDAQIAETASVGPYCVIEANAIVGDATVIGAHSYIGANVNIGCDGWIAPRVTIFDGVQIGDRVVIQSGAVIGGEGFGFAQDSGHWVKVAQVGSVVLGNDVEVGANTTIDRGAIGNTILGDDVKLDNQIQIGHNVEIGNHTAMAACVGISGSTKIGQHCLIGGSVGMAGHIQVVDHVHITGMTMVIGSILQSGIYSSGVAVQPAVEWRKNAARFRTLDQMARRLARLEKKIQSKKNADPPSSEHSHLGQTQLNQGELDQS